MSQKKSYQLGEEIENFTLRNVDAKNVSLSDFKDLKGVVVVFTCNHCPFSQLYESRIIKLAKNLPGKNFFLIAINPNDSTQVPEDSFVEMIKIARRKKYNFPYLHDATQEVAKIFGAARTPHFFVLQNKNGSFILRYKGALDDDPEQTKGSEARKYVEQVVEALVRNAEELPYVESKAVGCTIKWRK